MSKTIDILGTSADGLLNHECKTISKDLLHLPGNDFIERCFAQTNRNPQVLRIYKRFMVRVDWQIQDMFLFCQLIKV